MIFLPGKKESAEYGFIKEKPGISIPRVLDRIYQVVMDRLKELNLSGTPEILDYVRPRKKVIKRVKKGNESG